MSYLQCAELERRLALDSVQKELDDEEMQAEADRDRGHTDVRWGALARYFLLLLS